MGNLADEIFGITRVPGYCIPKPIGCGELISDFNDELSAREYEISGLCQSCQDRVFNIVEGEY